MATAKQPTIYSPTHRIRPDVVQAACTKFLISFTQGRTTDEINPLVQRCLLFEKTGRNLLQPCNPACTMGNRIMLALTVMKLSDST